MTLFSHGDALNYHLVIPKLVIDYSWKNVFESFFAVFLSGYFEALYLIPNYIFSNTPYAQIAGQLMHFSLSIGLSCWLFFHYLNKKEHAYLLSLAILTISMGGDFFLYAKNDGIVASLTLWLFFEVFSKKPEKWNPWLLGLLFGLIPSVKLSGVFTEIPLFIYILTKKYKDPMHYGKIIFLSLVIYSPIIIIKNYYLGGAIFFPALLSVFPGNLTANTITLFKNFVSAPLKISTLLPNIKFLFFSKILVTSSFILLIKQRKHPHALHFFLIITSAFTLMMAMNGGIYSERFLFPLTFIQFGVIGVLIEKYQFTSKHLLILVILIFADSKIDKTLKRIKNLSVYFQKDMETIRKEKIPLSTVWEYIKVNSEQKYTRVFTDRFVQSYYSPKEIRIDMYPSSPETHFYTNCKQQSNLDEILSYDYYIMYFRYSNECNDIIRKNSKLIYKISGYEVYQNIHKGINPSHEK